MNFFGVGPLEIVLVLIVAVIVLGPERFPQAAVQIARAIKTLRGYATSTTSQLRAELAELTREYEEVRKELQDFRKSVRADVSAMTNELDRVIAESQPIVEPAGEPPPARRRAPVLKDVEPAGDTPERATPQTEPGPEPAGEVSPGTDGAKGSDGQ